MTVSSSICKQGPWMQTDDPSKACSSPARTSATSMEWVMRAACRSRLRLDWSPREPQATGRTNSSLRSGLAHEAIDDVADEIVPHAWVVEAVDIPAVRVEAHPHELGFG